MSYVKVKQRDSSEQFFMSCAAAAAAASRAYSVGD